MLCRWGGGVVLRVFDVVQVGGVVLRVFDVVQVGGVVLSVL